MSYRKVIRSYAEMYRSSGFKLIKHYFFECHLYDLRNKTDTHIMLRKSQLHVNSQNIAHSEDYMVSWTSTIRNALSFLMQTVELEGYSFIDIGCGKGKVCLEARSLKAVGGEVKKYIGIDFDENLLRIARKNSLKMYKDEGCFIHSDVLAIDFTSISAKLLLFMYNPFKESVMRQLLEDVSFSEVIVVYINPVLETLFTEQGFKPIIQVKKWHPNLSYTIYERRPL